MSVHDSWVEANLRFVLAELKAQPEVATAFDPTQLSYERQLAQLVEWLGQANEYGLAYELIVCLLEIYPFRLTGAAAVKLLEVGLLMGFKTGRPEDARFNPSMGVEGQES